MGHRSRYGAGADEEPGLRGVRAASMQHKGDWDEGGAPLTRW